jgi:cytoskeletal protein CcmA (bactofilin family)
MALFSSSKDDDYQQEAVKAAKEAISSILAKDMRIEGEISFKGKARIDGNVQGNINGENLVLSESGSIKGDLKLVSFVCHGKVEGNIDAKLVTVHSTAAVQGRLTAGNLTVEPGARLSGEISTADNGNKAKAIAAGQESKIAPAKTQLSMAAPADEGKRPAK